MTELYIYKCDDNVEGLNFVGPSGLLFSMIPSCFLLRINNYFFLNISKELLLAEDLGFPYVDETTIILDEHASFTADLIDGTKTINQDILKQFKIKKSSKAIFQPRFRGIDKICNSTDSYIKNNSIDQSAGIGDIFIMDNRIRKMEMDEEYLFSPNETYNIQSLTKTLSIRVSKILLAFAQKEKAKVENSGLDDEEKKHAIEEIDIAIKYEKFRLNKASEI